MQAVIQRAVTGAQAQVLRTDSTASDTVTNRLTAEFPALAPATIARCVTDTWICAEHLGLAVTDGLVEMLAREHLLGLDELSAAVRASHCWLTRLTAAQERTTWANRPRNVGVAVRESERLGPYPGLHG